MTAPRHTSKHGAEVLLTALRDPEQAAGLGEESWDLLIRVARHTRLLGHLAEVMDERGLTSQLPARVVDHFVAARVFVSWLQRAARWEINRILAALQGSEVPLVLLKGSAYILAGLSPARGRLLSDVDVLAVDEDRVLVSNAGADHVPAVARG